MTGLSRPPRREPFPGCSAHRGSRVAPLLQASRTGDMSIIDAWLAAGAEPNAGPPAVETPLMAAARSGRADAVRLLLGKGAEINATDSNEHQTALMWAAAEGHV